MKPFPILFIASCLLLASCAGPLKPTSGEGTGARQAGEGRRAAPAEPTRAHFVQEGTAGVLRGTTAGKKDRRVPAASHRTLPLGVFVKVRNAMNGRETVVPILSRGPMTKRRIIDLSEEAAGALGVPLRGTVEVRIEAMGRRGGPGNVSVHPETYEYGVYTVQLRSFLSRQEAHRLVEMMKNLFGYSALAPADEGGKTVYRVFAGKYFTLTDAENAERNFTAHGYPECFVIALD